MEQPQELPGGHSAPTSSYPYRSNMIHAKRAECSGPAYTTPNGLILEQNCSGGPGSSSWLATYDTVESPEDCMTYAHRVDRRVMLPGTTSRRAPAISSIARRARTRLQSHLAIFQWLIVLNSRHRLTPTAPIRNNPFKRRRMACSSRYFATRISQLVRETSAAMDRRPRTVLNMPIVSNNA